jgi:hypothetical protein
MWRRILTVLNLNGRPVSGLPAHARTIKAELYTDASFEGGGYFFGGLWRMWRWPADMRARIGDFADLSDDDGIFICDAYGGSDSFIEMEEERHLDGFTYVWDQNHYNPITGDVINHIHFRFPDGSALEEAFTYEWRLWTIPEIRELLMEAGFGKVTVWWEGDDEDGEAGDGEFEPSERGEACPGWIAYLTAEK